MRSDGQTGTRLKRHRPNSPTDTRRLQLADLSNTEDIATSLSLDVPDDQRVGGSAGTGCKRVVVPEVLHTTHPVSVDPCHVL